jgi:hypothetical protein
MDDQHLGYIKTIPKRKKEKKENTHRIWWPLKRHHQSKIPIQYLESYTKEEVFFFSKVFLFIAKVAIIHSKMY